MHSALNSKTNLEQSVHQLVEKEKWQNERNTLECEPSNYQFDTETVSIVVVVVVVVAFFVSVLSKRIV